MREEEKKKVGFFEFRSRDPNRLDDSLEAIATEVVDALIEVHRWLGPGHLESVYETAVCHELTLRGIPFRRQAPVDVRYKAIGAGTGFIDILVADKIILELKSVEQIIGVHRAQLGAYLTATKLELGLIANFNVELMKDGIKRVVRKQKPTLP